MKKNLLLSAVAVMAMATAANAGGDITIPEYIPVSEPVVVQEKKAPMYIGVGVARGHYFKELCTNCQYEDVTYGLTLRAGYNINENLGIEARYIGTFMEEDPLAGQKLQHVGLYLKPMIEVEEGFELYGLLGFGKTTSKTHKGNRFEIDEVDASGFSAGIGAEYSLDEEAEGFGLFVDYQRLVIDSEQPDLDAISVGVSYDF